MPDDDSDYYDSTCTTNVQNSVESRICECDGDKVRYHCCTDSAASEWNFNDTINVYEFNYNYGTPASLCSAGTERQFERQF